MIEYDQYYEKFEEDAEKLLELNKNNLVVDIK